MALLLLAVGAVVFTLGGANRDGAQRYLAAPLCATVVAPASANCRVQAQATVADVEATPTDIAIHLQVAADHGIGATVVHVAPATDATIRLGTVVSVIAWNGEITELASGSQILHSVAEPTQVAAGGDELALTLVVLGVLLFAVAIQPGVFRRISVPRGEPALIIQRATGSR